MGLARQIEIPSRWMLVVPAQSVWQAMRVALLALALWCVVPALAQDVLPVPALSARVIDQTGTLNANQIGALDAKLAALEASKGSQLVVLMVPTTLPEDIASYANRVANAWKIGRHDVGDGVLLVVAKQDRKLRIEVAKTLEGAIPDLAASRIINGTITPRFKQGDFGGGVAAGVDQLSALIFGESLPEPTHADTLRDSAARLYGSLDQVLLLVFALPIGAALMRSILGRKLGAVVTGAGVGALGFFLSASLLIAGAGALLALLYTLLSNTGVAQIVSGWGRGSGGSGSHGSWGGAGGGGFSSGGGGDFGGGGASGSW